MRCKIPLKILSASAACASSLLLSNIALAVGDQSESKGFIEEQSLTGLLRNFYFNRDFRKGASNSYGAGKREEWVQGASLNYASGFTHGTVGFGLDAYTRGAIKLDSGGGTTGTQLLPIGDDRKANDTYGTAGGTLKMRLSRTQLNIGDFIPNTPAIYADVGGRLFPQIAHGWQLQSNDLANTSLELASFTSGLAGSGSTYDIVKTAYGNREVKRYRYGGGRYDFTPNLNASFYVAEAKDIFTLYYAGGNYTWPITQSQQLKFALNTYRQQDTGQSLAGEIDGFAAALTVAYSIGSHTFTVGAQKNNSDTVLEDLAFADGKATGLAMPMAMQVDEFQGPREKAFQLRYDLNMAGYGIPGLSFMIRHQMGRGDGSHADPNGDYARRWGPDTRHWERNIDVKYVIQSGPAKDLSFRVRQATVRENPDQPLRNIDETRLIVEYPFKLL